MTTKRELGELLIESVKTGIKIQQRAVGEREWYDPGFILAFNLAAYEYRLEHKNKVKRSGWFDAGFLRMHAERKPLQKGDVFAEWEEEE